MQQRIYQIVCRFEAVGIKEIPANTFEEAVELAKTDQYGFKQIGRIQSCSVDEMHSRIITEEGMSDTEKKEYLSWGSE